jgi:hypothetical protein
MDEINRALSLGNFGAKTDRILVQIQDIIKSTPTLPTEKINQLSSVLDQMSKIIDDILK